MTERSNQKSKFSTIPRQNYDIDEEVYIKDFPNAKKWLPGRSVDVQGPLSYHVKLYDKNCQRMAKTPNNSPVQLGNTDIETQAKTEPPDPQGH